MKKKGLIISTIVMVLVLAASLTTATYAWFASSSSAAIADIAIRTATSQGLSIAAVNGNEFYNGDLALNGTVWKGENLGFGGELSFPALETTDDLSKVYGVSGNGIDMFTAAAIEGGDANADGSVVSGKPLYTVAATANKDYFVLDFVLHNDNTTSQDIFISELAVAFNNAPTQPSYNMLRALRVAVFAETGAEAVTPRLKDETTSEGTLYANNKMLWDPYGKLTFDGVSNWSYNDSDVSGNKYVISAGAYNSVSSLSANTLATDWGSGYRTEALTTSGATNNAYNANSGILAAPKYTYVAGTAAEGLLAEAVGSGANGYVGVKMVIWFEGEDNTCIGSFAGAGISLGISFGSTLHS